ncbi:MAG: cyanoexosortase A [Pleurocapsa sp. MO_226.B13]|nr:cyanoexosortase A [Pleurocapsa sp. MO_226.B13]
MYVKNLVKNDRLWLFSSLIGISLLYLSSLAKTTGDIERLSTEALFWGGIIWFLWRKKERLNFDSDPVSSFIGFLLLGLVLFKTITLYSFESTLIPLFPVLMATALALIASGFRGLSQYVRELFFIWFLFFPTGVIGNFLDRIIHITVLNAKIASYFLYYLGFNVANSGNEVILFLPELGKFKAIVDYPCAGVPMILLIFKLSLLLISCVSLTRKQQILIPAFSLIFGFLLGVIRVCILTLSIPNQAQFNYWHGAQGSQIFSTLAVIVFSGFCYWLLQTNPKSIISN